MHRKKFCCWIWNLRIPSLSPMQMALLLRYQTFFLVAFHGVSCRWKRSGSNSFSVQQRLGSASVLWYLLHHRLQPALSLYFTSFVHQPMQPYSNSCMLHFSVFREFHLKWKILFLWYLDFSLVSSGPPPPSPCYISTGPGVMNEGNASWFGRNAAVPQHTARLALWMAYLTAHKLLLWCPI